MQNQQNKKIQIILDSQDFQGFTLLFAQVIGISLVVSWILGLEAGLTLLVTIVLFIIYVWYAIAQTKEKALLAIIEDLEKENERLHTLNALLINQAKQRKVPQKEK